MEIPQFILDLLEYDIPVNLCVREKDGKKIFGYEIDGFYKSGTVFLTNQLSAEWIAIARYDEREVINGLGDLVGLNYQWWQYSKDRWEGWKGPDCRWAALLITYKYIEPTTVVVYKELQK